MSEMGSLVLNQSAGLTTAGCSSHAFLFLSPQSLESTRRMLALVEEVSSSHHLCPAGPGQQQHPDWLLAQNHPVQPVLRHTRSLAQFRVAALEPAAVLATVSPNQGFPERREGSRFPGAG